MAKRTHNIPALTAHETAHSLALLGEYTHTLDSLPLDLSRSFADLRELDAVLSSSMSVLTAKINELTIMLENKSATKEDRLWLLTQIAEEAARLKLGGEDKIRVACQAADGLRGHKAHMKTLVQHLPDPDFESIELIGRKTIFPHVATRSYMPVGGAGEGGRRQRRGAYGSLLSSTTVDASPNKRKRATGRDDDLDLPSKTPRKERTGDAPRQRNRNRRPERAPSPAESLLSVASHFPPSASQDVVNVSNSRPNVARGTNSSSIAKRSRAGQSNIEPQTVSQFEHEKYNAPPSSSTAHPSLPVPYANGLNGMNGTRINGVTEWAHGQLEGPGMPVARTFVGVVTAEPHDIATGTGAEADGEVDDGRTYCFCDGVSYGDMIACDDDNCEREWFHLPCIGLTVPPEGTWFCDACRARRNARRSGRGGKKRSGGGRSNARNAST
ncbi:uncharacterized protein FIBRA_00147 [Fibroporia radiculosa]|uniref:Chromatin modification-related protein n=1 Tax=Fibroporia radiculosa TaxID=599839 RepID=J7SCJ2_9APHY|nr:uncharacterized protein FIBRA_00147 [Fibroporia radiculosa]CCL98153.1 predicted protein [Fibroporia radiculosa]